jgi:hypothetical protein
MLLGRVALASLGFGLGVTAETGVAWRRRQAKSEGLGLVEAARATAGPMQEPLESWGRLRQACWRSLKDT